MRKVAPALATAARPAGQDDLGKLALTPMGAATPAGAAPHSNESASNLRRKARDVIVGGSLNTLIYPPEQLPISDHRRLANGALAHRALGLALKSPICRTWKGYWHRS